MAIIPFLNDGSLKKFIRGVKISQKEKNFLISKLPEMDFEDRKALLETLFKIYLLDLEEKKVIERIKKSWEK